MAGDALSTADRLIEALLRARPKGKYGEGADDAKITDRTITAQIRRGH
jgi:hypothetical protein